MMMSSTNLLAQTQTLNLNPDLKHNIAEKLIEGQICKVQLANTQSAYGKCVDDHHPNTQWWQKPEVEIAGVTVTIAVTTILICVTHAMGACK